MKILITGGCKMGKSDMAQDLTIYLSKEGARYYVATMIPTDHEDLSRIQKHLDNRAGLGFDTIECGRHIEDALKTNGGRGAYLLDSVTALMANEMFQGAVYDRDAAARILPEIRHFLDESDHAVLVFDGIYSDAAVYDEMTENYRASLAFLLRELAAVCDTVVEMTAGQPDLVKGELPPGFEAWMTVTDKSTEKAAQNIVSPDAASPLEAVVIGGAFQGQEAYAKAAWQLADEDICVCRSDAEPDFSRRCFIFPEQYVLYCLRHGIEPRCDFREDTILVGTDMACGIVPVDEEMRLFREAASHYMTAAAKRARHVVRVTCGLPQILK